MLCHICKKNEATVHVTELLSFPVVDPAHPEVAAAETPSLEERHICERCAHRSKIPISAITTHKGLAMWNMLKESARRAREENSVTCPDCGMTLAEFRSKGRFGCARDYEIFKAHVQPLLLRIHNATAHTGRLPVAAETQRDQVKKAAQMDGLCKRLKIAIRDEAYESAAKLRDEIQNLSSVQEDAS